jgi:hypothetical protein
MMKILESLPVKTLLRNFSAQQEVLICPSLMVQDPAWEED